MDDKFTIINEPEKASTQLLKHAVKDGNAQIAELQAQIDAIRDRLYDYKAIINVREVAAYWKSHPEFEPINQGDKIRITEEYQAWYLQHTRRHPITDVGDVLEVNYVSMVDGKPDSFGVRHASTPYEVVLKLRRAYLNSESEGNYPRPRRSPAGSG